MNSTLINPLIATAQANCILKDTVDEQEKAQLELDQHIEVQSECIAQQDNIAGRLCESNRARVALALADGKLYALQKTKLGKAFTSWLKNNGLVRKIASMYIKLYEIYKDFSLDQIGLVDIKTLISLTSPRYELLLGKLKFYQQWTQAIVEDLMQQERHEQKVLKSVDCDRNQEDDSGWRRMPSGGGRYYSLNLHDEPTAIAIERYAKSENIRREQVVKTAIDLFEQSLKGSSSSQNLARGLWEKTTTVKLDNEVKGVKERLE